MIRMAMIGGISTMAMASTFCSMATEYEQDSSNHWPAVFYGPEGQEEVFTNPLEVPEGWHDAPGKVGDKNAKTDIPGYDEAVAAANLDAEEGEDVEDDEDESKKPGFQPDDKGTGPGADGEQGQRNTGAGDPDANISQQAGDRNFVLPPKGEIDKAEIVKLLKARKVNFNEGWKVDRLYDLLKDAIDTKATGAGLKPVAEGNSL